MIKKITELWPNLIRRIGPNEEPGDDPGDGSGSNSEDSER